MNPSNQSQQQQPRPAFNVTSAINPRPPAQKGPAQQNNQQGPNQMRPLLPHTGTCPARPHLAPAQTGPMPQNGVPLPSQRPSQPGSEGNAAAGPSSYKPTQAKQPGTSKWSKPVELRTDPRAVVSKLLYVHGDVETPQTEAVDFVLDMAYDFMVQLMNPGPAPKPCPPHFNATSQSQTITTSTLRHRLRGPHNRKKLAVLQEAIIKQKLAADKAKKAAIVEKKPKRKAGETGEADMDVDDLAANLDMPGMNGFGGIF